MSANRDKSRPPKDASRAKRRTATERKAAAKNGERDVQRRRVLYQSSLVFGQSHDPARVGKHIIATVEQLVNFQRGSIWLIRENTAGLDLLAHSDLGLGSDALAKELARVRSLVPRPGE
ncbi:MAG: hypothetical protein ABI217_03510, partial [Chthoniobacterales bacterium]